MEIAPTTEQQMALSFLQTSSSIATPRQLAEYRNALVKAPDGALVLAHPRYGQLPIATRVNWMKDQLMVLNYLRHIKDPNPLDILIDAQAADSSIMESADFRALTQLEIQEAFRHGIDGAYGEFFGITSVSLTGFLRGYMKSEKWQEMKTICYAEEQKKLKEGDERFWSTLAKAREDGVIDIPEFPHNPFEDDKQRLARLERQRQEILKAYEKK